MCVGNNLICSITKYSCFFLISPKGQPLFINIDLDFFLPFLFLFIFNLWHAGCDFVAFMDVIEFRELELDKTKSLRSTSRISTVLIKPNIQTSIPVLFIYKRGIYL